jgi:hypothetical protein
VILAGKKLKYFYINLPQSTVSATNSTSPALGLNLGFKIEKATKNPNCVSALKHNRIRVFLLRPKYKKNII